MAKEECSIILPFSQVQLLLNSVQQVPALMARIQQSEAALTALRGLYSECLSRLSELQHQI